MWFVGYSSQGTCLPGDPPGAHKSRKHIAGGEWRMMVCLPLPVQPGGADRLAKVRQVKLGCAAYLEITLICLLLSQI